MAPPRQFARHPWSSCEVQPEALHPRLRNAGPAGGPATQYKLPVLFASVSPLITKLTRVPGSSPSWLTSFQYPYILTQGATDQPRIEHALLGIVIQFEETPQ